jgi:hypothetical protein
MKKTWVPVLIGAALIIGVAVGYTVGCATAPGGGLAPDVQYYVVTFTLDNDENPTKIIVDPEDEGPVRPNDVVVFANKTGKVVTVDFKNHEPTGSPFDEDHETFEVQKEGSEGGHAEGAEVTYDVPTGQKEVTFKYNVVTDDGLSAIWDGVADQSSQSPRIRVGPKD